MTSSPSSSDAWCREYPETRRCPRSFPGGCGGRPCARHESDDASPWLADMLTEAGLDVRLIERSRGCFTHDKTDDGCYRVSIWTPAGRLWCEGWHMTPEGLFRIIRLWQQGAPRKTCARCQLAGEPPPSV